jgi:hypothetical protein
MLKAVSFQKKIQLHFGIFEFYQLFLGYNKKRMSLTFIFSEKGTQFVATQVRDGLCHFDFLKSINQLGQANRNRTINKTVSHVQSKPKRKEKSTITFSPGPNVTCK